jgi:hypothetical protein
MPCLAIPITECIITPKGFVKNNFPKCSHPFVLRRAQHERVTAFGWEFSVHPSTSSTTRVVPLKGVYGYGQTNGKFNREVIYGHILSLAGRSARPTWGNLGDCLPGNSPFPRKPLSSFETIRQRNRSVRYGCVFYRFHAPTFSTITLKHVG